MLIKQLGDLGELRTGFQLRGPMKNVAGAPHRVITLGDVTDDGIAYERLAHMDLGDRAFRFLLEYGEILLRARGATYKGHVFTDTSEPTVPLAPLYVLRLREQNVLPEFLVWWINRDQVQDVLRASARGTYIPTVSRESFATIEIPIVPLSLQDKVVDMNRLVQEEIRLGNELARRRCAFVEAVLYETIQHSIGADQA